MPLKITLVGSRYFGAAVLDQVGEGRRAGAAGRHARRRRSAGAARAGVGHRDTRAARCPARAGRRDRRRHRTDRLAHTHARVDADALAKARLGGIGYHPSLLPRHRGIAAVEWTVKCGDAIAGGSIYHLAERMDAGAIAAQDWCFVKPGEGARELWERALAPLGIRLLDAGGGAGQRDRRPAGATAGRTVRHPGAKADAPRSYPSNGQALESRGCQVSRRPRGAPEAAAHPAPVSSVAFVFETGVGHEARQSPHASARDWSNAACRAACACCARLCAGAAVQCRDAGAAHATHRARWRGHAAAGPVAGAAACVCGWRAVAGGGRHHRLGGRARHPAVGQARRQRDPGAPSRGRRHEGGLHHRSETVRRAASEGAAANGRSVERGHGALRTRTHPPERSHRHFQRALADRPCACGRRHPVCAPVRSACAASSTVSRAIPTAAWTSPPPREPRWSLLQRDA